MKLSETKLDNVALMQDQTLCTGHQTENLIFLIPQALQWLIKLQINKGFDFYWETVQILFWVYTTHTVRELYEMSCLVSSFQVIWPTAIHKQRQNRVGQK